MRNQKYRRNLWLLTAFVYLIIECGGRPSQAACTSPPYGLVSWWPGDGNGTDIVSGNNGTFPNGIAYAPGKVGQAFSFDGATTYVNVQDAPGLDPTNGLTLEGWVYVSGSPPIDDLVAIVTKENAISHFVQYQMTLVNSAGHMYFEPVFRVPSGYVSFLGSTEVHTGVWYYVAVTYDGSSLTQYVNGSLDGSLPASGPLVTDSGPLTIGCAQGGWFFSGGVDELSLYNRALSPTELQTIFEAGSAGKCKTPEPPIVTVQPTNIVANTGDVVIFQAAAAGTSPMSFQWLFDSTNVPGATSASLQLIDVQTLQAGVYTLLVSNDYGSVLSSNATLTVNPGIPCIAPPAGLVSWWPGQGDGADIVSGNNGTFPNGIAYASGKVDQAFAFNGASTFVQVPDSPTLDPTNALTLEGWIYVSGPPQLNSVVGIATKESPVSVVVQYQMTLVNSGGSMYFQPVLRVPSGYISFLGSTAIQTGIWYHLAVTYDGSSVKQFVNGILDGSQPATGPVFVDSGPLTIGCSQYGWFFNGRVDELSLYNRALTLTELQFIYKAGYSGKCRLPLPPTVTLEPTNIVANTGDTVVFETGAAGTPPVSFQWLFNSTNLPGATSASLQLIHVDPLQAGVYTLFVSNAYGSVLSSNVTLTVNPGPPCARPPQGLVAWWPGENSATDVVGGNDGMLVAGAGYDWGMVGHGFALNGEGQYVTISDAPALNPSSGLTIETWVYPLSAPGYGMGIVCKDDVVANRQYMLNLTTSGQAQPILRAHVGTTEGLAVLDGTNTVPLYTWTHVAMTYDGALLRLYVNGALDSSLVVNAPLALTTQPVYIGADGGYFFNGRIDEVSLYGRALTLPEIQSIYNSSSTGKCAGPVPPFIVSQPTSQTVFITSNATVSVTAGGTIPLGYQWSFNGSPIAGATNTSITLTNVQFSQAGSYSVLITNAVGSTVSSNAVLNPIYPPALVQIGGTNVASGGTISLPISLVANGNENALGLSLIFDQTILAYAGASLGSGGSGALLLSNTSMTNSGKIGLAAAFPPNMTFPSGTQTVFQINFVAAVLTNGDFDRNNVWRSAHCTTALG